MKKFEAGQIWRGKRPMISNGFVNDRRIIHIDITGSITYDHPSLQDGHTYPTVLDQADFDAWAARPLRTTTWTKWDFSSPSKNI